MMDLINNIQIKIPIYTHKNTIQCIIYTHIIDFIVIFIWLSPFIPSRNLYDVFTYNHMTLLSIRSRSHVKATIIVTKADHYVYKII